MKFTTLSLFPELFEAFSQKGVVGQAIQKDLIQYQNINPRNFTTDKHKTVDDRPYGGGEGMVLMPEPLMQALKSLAKPEGSRQVILLSPQGEPFAQKTAERLSNYEEVVLICGRYEGIDQRFISQYVDEEISLGDFILSGGELGALTVIDAVSRLKPGVLGNEISCINESFSKGLLEGPQFTRPSEFEGLSVPSVLLSGHHERVQRWRYLVSLLKTRIYRQDLYFEAQIQAEDWDEALRLFNEMNPLQRKVCGLPEQLNL